MEFGNLSLVKNALILLENFMKIMKLLNAVIFFMKKVEKARNIKGTKYIHILAPCPTGWGIKTDETVEIAKEVVDCGLWYLAEYENGQFHLNYQPKEFSDIEKYLKKQARFKHLTDDDIEIIKKSRDEKWEYINQNFK